MKSLLSPAPELNGAWAAHVTLFLLVVSAISLLIAPFFMPESYSWTSHTTSESAAQGVKDAWLARLGFVTFGLAVIRLATVSRQVWAFGAVLFHMGFGVCMVGTAAFSIRSWIPDTPYDTVEDFLHSFTATTMGFGFNFGVLVRFLQRRKNRTPGRWFDGMALVIATVIPILMVFMPTIDGLLQRSMFLTAYLWYGREASCASIPERHEPSR